MTRLAPYRPLLLLLMMTLVSGLTWVTAQDAEPTDEVTDESARREIARPLPAQSITEDGVTLNVLFGELPQGRAGLLHVEGESLAGARVRFINQLNDFFPANDGYYGFVVADMDQTPRVYDFEVLAWLDDGTRVTLPAQVEVVLGGFLRSDVDIPQDRAFLIDPQVERAEFARLDAIFEPFTPEKHWGTEGFRLPIDSELTAQFGEFRTFNGTNVPARHTGWDLRAPVGTEVRTMGAGVVAYAGLLDIRGNHVVIDHGYGIYSGYSHLSQIHVTRGQTIYPNQIIGVSGNTGRSGGPHLHWEIAINGKWVDSADFLQMWLP